MNNLRFVKINAIYASRRMDVIRPYINNPEFSFYKNEYENYEQVIELCKRYNKVLSDTNKGYIDIGLILKEFHDKELHFDVGPVSIDNFASEMGMSKSFAYNLLNVVTRFYDSEQKCLVTVGDKNLNFYTISKLVRLCPLSDHQIATYTDPDMTVKELEEVVKRFKKEKEDKNNNEEKLNNESNVIDDDEADIPEAYDVHKYYEFSYFENMTKNQLINIVWELQKTYVKKK